MRCIAKEAFCGTQDRRRKTMNEPLLYLPGHGRSADSGGWIMDDVGMQVLAIISWTGCVLCGNLSRSQLQVIYPSQISSWT